MAAVFTSMQQHPGYCTSSASACTSVRCGLILDTAIAAVSIFVLILGRLLGIY